MNNDYWDMHCHILPGVDDGSCCMEEALDMIEEEYRQGIRKIIMTPHYRKGMFETSAKEIERVFQQVKEGYHCYLGETCPGMTLLTGCELYMHPDQSRNAGTRSYRMPGRDVLLTEFAYEDDLEVILNTLMPLLEAGYRCVIAHVERYHLGEKDIRVLKEQKGIYIQCNADAILGIDGLFIRHFTRKLIQKGLVDFIGSDGHNTHDRVVRIGDCIRWVNNNYGKETAERIFLRNPRKLFR